MRARAISIELVAEDARHLDCEQAMRQLGTIARHDTSAQEPWAIYRGLHEKGASNTMLCVRWSTG